MFHNYAWKFPETALQIITIMHLIFHKYWTKQGKPDNNSVTSEHTKKPRTQKEVKTTEPNLKNTE